MHLLRYTFGLLILLVFLLLPSSVSAQKKVTVSPSPTAAPVDSYKLFWPITAGKVMGDSLYSVKVFKENLREFFIFSELKKADYNMVLSEKRTVEAEKLFLDKKDYPNGKASLEVAQARREKAFGLLEKAQKGERNIIDGVNRLISSFGRQKALLTYLASQVPQEQKAILQDSSDHIDSLLKSIEQLP